MAGNSGESHFADQNTANDRFGSSGRLRSTIQPARQHVCLLFFFPFAVQLCESFPQLFRIGHDHPGFRQRFVPNCWFTTAPILANSTLCCVKTEPEWTTTDVPQLRLDLILFQIVRTALLCREACRPEPALVAHLLR